MFWKKCFKFSNLKKGFGREVQGIQPPGGWTEVDKNNQGGKVMNRYKLKFSIQVKLEIVLQKP